MECPVCGLHNPATAEQCDCGYHFLTKKLDTPTGSVVDRKIIVGIGGWLLLLVIKLFSGAAIRTSYGIANFPHGVAVMNLVFGLAGGTAAFLLCVRNVLGVKVAKVYLGAEAIYYFVDLVLGLGLQ